MGLKISYLCLKRLVVGLSQTELAKQMGVSQSIVSAYEGYRVQVPQSRLARYCELLGITPEEYHEAYKRKRFLTLLRSGGACEEASE